MPLSIVSRVAFDADATHTRGEPKRAPVAAQQRPAADPPPDSSQTLEMPSEGEDAEDSAASTAGLSILAQALAAYSQN